MFKIKLMKL